MAVQRAYTSAAIHRMERLCAAAAAEPEGVEIELNNRAEALKLRGQIYAARQALFRRSPDAETALATIEMHIENKGKEITDPHVLRLVPQFTGLTKLKVKSASSGEYIALKPFAEENVLAGVDDIVAEMRVTRGPVLAQLPRDGSKAERTRVDKDYLDGLKAREDEATVLFERGYRAKQVLPSPEGSSSFVVRASLVSGIPQGRAAPRSSWDILAEEPQEASYPALGTKDSYKVLGVVKADFDNINPASLTFETEDD